MIGEVKKDIGLEEKLLSRDGSMDDVKNLISSNSKFEELLKFYEDFLSVCKGDVEEMDILQGPTTDIVLSPKNILAFLNATISFSSYSNYMKVTGKVITNLLQNSFDAGYNDFLLSNAAEDLEFLAVQLQGNSKNHLNLRLEGGVGQVFAGSAQYINVLASGGAAEYSCMRSSDCNFTFYQAVVPVEFASDAEDCIFELYGGFTGFDKKLTGLYFNPGVNSKDCKYIFNNEHIVNFVKEILEPENTVRLVDDY
tara:strand:- start:4168 stop:4926 length:759 start_codon:yes stop_codon:yes gene_type:complete